MYCETEKGPLSFQEEQDIASREVKSSPLSSGNLISQWRICHTKTFSKSFVSSNVTILHQIYDNSTVGHFSDFNSRISLDVLLNHCISFIMQCMLSY